MNMRLLGIISACLLMISLQPCFAAEEKKESKDNAALPKSASAVIDALTGITEATGKVLETSRMTDRAHRLRSAAYTSLLGGSPDLSVRSLLCVPRGTYAADIAQRAYLLQVSGLVQKTATVEISGFIAAFSSFGETVDIKAPPKLKISDIPSKTISTCEEDIKKSLDLYFGRQPHDKTGLIDEAISLWNLVSGLVKTAVVDTAQLVAEQKRRKAILAFLKDNSDQISRVSNNLLDHLAVELRLDRANAGATFLNAQDAFARTLGKSLGGVKDKACKTTIDGASASPPLDIDKNKEFWECWRAMWNGEVSAAAKALVEAASAYDSAADLGLTKADGAKSVLSDALAAVKKGDEEKSFDRFLTVLNQVLGIAKDYQTLFSKDTRDKVKKSVDTIIADVENGSL